MRWIKKFLNKFRKRPIVYSLICSIIGTFIFCIVFNVWKAEGRIDFDDFNQILLFTLISSVFVGFPVVLTIADFITLFSKKADEGIIICERKIEGAILILGPIYTIMYMSLTNITFSDWHVQLKNAQVHTPIAGDYMGVICSIAIIGLIGYIILRYVPLKKLPPMAGVLSIAAIYLLSGESILWMVQIYRPSFMDSFFMMLLPVNVIVISIKAVKDIMLQWKAEGDKGGEGGYYGRSPFIRRLDAVLKNAFNWPWLGLIAALPLMGIIIAVLMLFGQAPDSIVKAWTETADWNLSQRTGPQNIYYDEHYLCTVAAGGHRRIVKPIRMGVRHGHKVIVNRQLCIANAFEEILEEKTPKFHRFVRYIYDKYGYPLARIIKSPYTADMVYFMMKPLEWIFLFVIYLLDVKPENRIALQYIIRPKGY